MSIELFVSGVATKVAVDAIYYLSRLIRHRAGFISGSVPRLLVEGLKNEPSPEAETLALKLVEKIESETNTPLENLDERTAAEIIDQLERVVRDRYTEGTTIDQERGDALLKDLRGSSRL
jgi:hypothetical protein